MLTGSILLVCFLAFGALQLFAANIIAAGCFVPICCIVIFMLQLARWLQHYRGMACKALLVPCCQLMLYGFGQSGLRQRGFGQSGLRQRFCRHAVLNWCCFLAALYALVAQPMQ